MMKNIQYTIYCYAMLYSQKMIFFYSWPLISLPTTSNQLCTNTHPFHIRLTQCVIISDESVIRVVGISHKIELWQVERVFFSCFGISWWFLKISLYKKWSQYDKYLARKKSLVQHSSLKTTHFFMAWRYKNPGLGYHAFH